MPEARGLEPHYEAAERAVLGCLFLLPDLLREVEELFPADFYFERHQLFFAAMLQLSSDGEPIDRLTIERAIGSERWEAIGGLAFAAALDVDLPDTSGLRSWVDAVREASARRQALALAGELHRRAVDTPRLDSLGRPLGPVLADSLITIADRLESIRSAAPGGGHEHWRELSAVNAEDDILAPRQPRDDRLQAMTSIPSLDRSAGLLCEGSLTLVCGRMGTGKTALALQIAAHNAIDRAVPSGVVSLEMDRKELLRRIVAARAQVNYTDLRRRTITDLNRVNCRHALDRIKNAPLFIDDRESLSSADIAAQIRRLKARHSDAFLFVVDYLHLVQLPGDTRERHDIRLGAVATNLARLARSLKIAVVLVCQLGRRGEQEKRPPVLADISDSDRIARDAFAVLALHRAYEEDRPGILAQDGVLAVLKNRGGDQFSVPVRFYGAWQYFVELDAQRQEVA